MLKVLHVTQYLRYGSARGIVNWIKAQTKREVEVCLLLSEPFRGFTHDPSLIREVLAANVKIVQVHSTFERTHWHAQAVVRKLSPYYRNGYHIHTHGGFTAMALGEAGIPFVHTVHGLGMKRAFWVDQQDKAGLGYARAVSGISRDTLKQALALNPYVKNTILTPYIFEVPPKAPIPVILSRGKITTLGQVGDMVELKGHEYSLRALAELKRKGFNLQLKLIGDGPLKSGLQGLVRDLGIESEVEFCGFKPKNNVYDGLDLVLVPSLKEGLGLVSVESLMQGIPVCAFYVGGIPEVLTHQRTGLLSEVSVQGLVHNIMQYLNQPELAATHVRQGYYDLASRFSESNGLDGLSRLYDLLK
ncbi:MAG: glycosyltransferase family 4 protein [Candidatus Cloacimonetes bacterium]|nr:glycosyltransferase family 4 protein [Candidatus Cloacimonadota bacterium]